MKRFALAMAAALCGTQAAAQTKCVPVGYDWSRNVPPASRVTITTTVTRNPLGGYTSTTTIDRQGFTGREAWN